MASLHVFTPFVDKENAADAGFRKGRLKSDSGNPLKAHVGKTFQSGIGQTPLRRALGVVNRSNLEVTKAPQQQKPQQKPFEKPTPRLQHPPPTLKPCRQKVEKPKVTQPQPMAKELFSTDHPIQIYVDEIESMPLPTAVMSEETFKWPVAECPATYIKELREWRAWPFCQPAADPEYIPSFEEESEDEDDGMLPTISEHSYEDPAYLEPFANEGPVLLTWEDLELPTLDELDTVLETKL